MKLFLLHLTIVFVLSVFSFAQKDYAAKISPDSIHARIKAHRMGQFIIKTKPDAEIKVEQTRHEFLFGTAIPNFLAENA